MVPDRCVVGKLLQAVGQLENRHVVYPFFVVDPPQGVHHGRFVGQFFLGFLGQRQRFVQILPFAGQAVGQIVGRRQKLRVDLERFPVLFDGQAVLFFSVVDYPEHHVRVGLFGIFFNGGLEL